MLRAFSIPNLATQQIAPEHAEPWFTAPAIPPFPDRDAYKRWMSAPTSVVPLFSLIEGDNPMLRVSTANPPRKVHGIVTDYDSVLTDAEVKAGLERIPSSFPPFAWNRTRRGGIRVVWRFEHPIFYYGDDTFARFMKRATKELKLTGLFPSLDEEILTKPDQCYAAGDKWTVNEVACIKSETLGLWLFDVLRKSTDFSNEIEIPLDVVKAEVDRQFPGRWQGEFTEGARGLRFWDPTADNPTAAIVRKTGMTAFTGDQGFLSWRDILGRDFVSKYQEDRIGRAVAEMWCDAEKNYYRRLPNGNWDMCGTDVTRRHLKGFYGLSDAVRRGEDLSEVDRVLHHLEMNRRIEGLLPFPHTPTETVNWAGQTYLNAATGTKLMKPADTKGEIWGLNFPMLARYLSALMIDEKNLNIFLAWYKVWYESCLAGKPRRGQALFLVGPPGTGKTFLSVEVLANTFGGYADARNYFVEGNRFNSSMFDKVVWSLDDSTILGDRRMHQKFSGLVKACVANPSMSYEKKYGYSGNVLFTGRFICTLNDDPTSLGILPDTDQSLLDKCILVRTGDLAAQLEGDAYTNHDTLMAELPYFLRWLVEWEIPADIPRNDRFGIDSWHDGKVLEEAHAASESSTVLQAVEMWIEGYEPAKDGTPWVGNATALLGAMRSNDTVREVVGRMTPVWLGRNLTAACESGAAPWIRRKYTGMKWVFEIRPPGVKLS